MFFLRTILLQASLRTYDKISRYGGLLALGIMLSVYGIGFVVFNQVEPIGSELHTLHGYTWYFWVTSSTVGYGDLYPTTQYGRLMGATIILSGVGSFGILLSYVTIALSKISEKMRKGLMDLNKTDHIVIIGYHPERTERIVRQILADDNREKRDIVLCFNSSQSDENPIPEVTGVKGTLDSDDVLERACVSDAYKIMIDIGEDDRALAIALAVSVKNADSHCVVGLNEMHEGPTKINRIYREAGFECALWADYKLMVQALQDPGIARLHNILSCNHRGNEYYQIQIPDYDAHFIVGDFFIRMKEHFGATMIGICTTDAPQSIIENPQLDEQLSSGDSIFYISEDRISEKTFSDFLTKI